MNIILQAKSSGTVPYDVEFNVENSKLTVRCSCKAGIFGKLCKHKTEFMAGDSSRLFDPSQAKELERVQALMGGIPELDETASAIVAAEEVVRREQAKLKSLKKELAGLLHSGVAISETSR